MRQGANVSDSRSVAAHTSLIFTKMFFTMFFSYLLWIREDFGNMNWNSNLIDPEVRVRRDDRSSGKIHSLSTQVTTETS